MYKLYRMNTQIDVNAQDLTIRFGKFNGKKYKDVDIDYLKWLNEKGFWDDCSKFPTNAVIKKYIEERILKEPSN